MNIKKGIAVVLTLLLALSFSSMVALAKSDVDFTIAVDTTLEYVSEMEVTVPIEIKTQTENGFVDLEMFLIFDADYLACSTIVTDVDGWTTFIQTRESDGQTGLVMQYSSPDGSKSVMSETPMVFTVTFAVKTNVASNENCMLKLETKPDKIFGLNSNGEKNPGLLTVSVANDKALKIVETSAGNVTTDPASSSDPNYYFTTPSVNQQVQTEGGSCSSCSTFGNVVLILFGALVMFAAGVVVGFVLCQKHMNEDGYNVPPLSLGSLGLGKKQKPAPRSYNEAQEDYTRSTGRSGGSIYDDDYMQRPSRVTTRRPPVLDEDDLVDTSYFGHASDARLGANDTTFSSGGFEDDDEDDFPQDLAPRKRDAGFLGSSSRRERNDDGYGAFDAGLQNSGGFDDGDDDDSPTDYRSDRRRFR